MIKVNRTEEWPEPTWNAELGAVRVMHCNAIDVYVYRGTWWPTHADWVPPEVRAAAERVWERHRPLADNEVRSPDGGLRTLSMEGDTLVVSYDDGSSNRYLRCALARAPGNAYAQALLDYYDTHHPGREATPPLPERITINGVRYRREEATK